MNFNYNLAPGLGDLLPGSFNVPQNPIMDASSPIVPSMQATDPNKVGYRPRIGELLAGTFVVPQNPIMRNLATGMGCLSCGMSGLGDTAAAEPSFMTSSTIISGIPDVAIWAGGALLVYMLMAPSGKEYRESTAGARSKYRGYKRLARRVAA